MTRSISLFVGLCSVLALTGCGDDDAGGSDAAPDTTDIQGDRRAVVASIAENAILPAMQDFARAAAGLATAAETFSDTPTDDAARGAVQMRWVAANRAWQRVEMMQVGPAGRLDLTMAGEDRRDAIYSWPTVNRCRVDQELVEQAYLDPAAFASEAPNVRGLDALEYLLFRDNVFAEATQNSCSDMSRINTDGLWTEVVPVLLERRAAYAKTAAQMVQDDADALVARWEGADGFLLEFTTEDGSVYRSAQEGLNAISDALFYLDKETKDMKIADPAGLRECASGCEEGREFSAAPASLGSVAQNLRGFRAVFTGGDELGFDDLLDMLDQDALRAEMLTDIDDAIARADLLASNHETLATALESDRDGVLALHADIVRITTNLKTQFLTVLDLELPDRAEGDDD